jgi:ATP-dependent RNA helicase DOB1
LPELIKEEERKAQIVVPEEEVIADYYELRNQLDELKSDFRDVITHPSYSLPFLQPGRLVKIRHDKMDFGWGVIINYQKRLPPKVRFIIRPNDFAMPMDHMSGQATTPARECSSANTVCS